MDLEYGVAPAGYRLPAATRVGRVVLQVSSLERSLAFYTEVLGLRLASQAPGSALLGDSAGEGVLVELRERAGARPVRQQSRLGLYHFAVLLPDRASLGRFLAHAGALGVPLGAGDHLVSEALYLNDPDGLGIEVYADRPRETWRAQGGQLVMTTDPLDTRSLLAAAGDTTWSGAPAGTVIGHVHLHVGDIARASSFYHEGMGFDRVVWNYPGALFLSAGGYHHHLGLNTWARGAPSPSEDDAQLLWWELVLPSGDDVDAALASVAAAGGEVEDDVASDPWGTRVRVVSA